MSDEPFLTRWSFQDFKFFYDAKFGRKREPKPEEEDAAMASQSNGNTAANGGTTTQNGGRKRELAVYEQYRNQASNGTPSNGVSANGAQDNTVQKPMLPPFEDAETRNLAESLCRDIIRGSQDVNWESIKGLETAKRLLKEAVVMPIKYPNPLGSQLSSAMTINWWLKVPFAVFHWTIISMEGHTSVWPPGTGKTMLAKAVATECNTTFFNISASSVVSKWRGDSEKLVKVLFELARHHAPSTVFVDEIDSVISHRGEARSEHEASRRLKTELLIQMDGLSKSNELVFVLAATNLPWELDAAMLRRLEKRILVPLPDPEARRGMFEELLPSTPNDDQVPYDVMVEKTEGYSGSDIRLVCKEAAMQPLRRLVTVLEQKTEVIPEDELPPVGPIELKDIELALKNTRPSAHLHAHRYEKFNEDYGSHIIQ
uniref:AAA+ ATPase domain-containing protein n=1 Tax=Chenopodium quinoa TaxID=63459 RepID=A0A803MIU0_CHEQI